MFQSTHPHGVRRDVPVAAAEAACFNPRTRMGCDEWAAKQHCRPVGFNPRTRMGCEVGERIKALDNALFQSTHPHGVRLGRSEAGRSRLSVSIHAPAWGATSAVVENIPLLGVSIHAPAWGATVPQKTGDLPGVWRQVPRTPAKS